MFQFISQKLKNIFSQVTSKLATLFHTDRIDEATLFELEKLLLAADTGVSTTRTIIALLQKRVADGLLVKGIDLKKALEEELLHILHKASARETHGHRGIYLLVGVNGSGKTTSVAKLAHYFKNQGKRVLLVAADTFRAAAYQQLQAWAQAIDVPVVCGTFEQDPASVVFRGCEKFIEQSYDIVIIDTAGRLQTKVNLMKELEKVRRIIHKKLPDAPIHTLLTIDSMLGQNSLEQAKLFHESTQVTGLILTKMDGTGKGGIIFSIVDTLGIPVEYITFGEQLDQIAPFDAHTYVKELLNDRS